MHQSSSLPICRVAAIVLIPLLSCATSAQADDFIWGGASNGIWNDAGNWASSSGNGGFPTSVDDVFFTIAPVFSAPSSTIDLNGNREILSLTFDNSNDYTILPGGAFRLTLGSGDLTASGTGGLDLSSIRLGSDGIWDISNTVTVNGLIDGNKSLTKQGGGILQLTGGSLASPSTLSTLRSTGGEVIVDGGHIDLTSSDFTFTSSALNTNGGNIQLRGGAVVDMTASDASGDINNGTLSVTGNGTSLTGVRLDAGSLTDQTGSIVVQNDASVVLDEFLNIGFKGVGDLTVRNGGQVSSALVAIGIENTEASTVLVTGADSRLIVTGRLALGGQSSNSLGGTGELTVSDGGLVEVEETRFFSSSSRITVDGGTLKTDRLRESNDVLGTVRIADAVGGTALTVGTNNGSSTFNGLIEDFNSTSGSLAKVDSGSFTLNGSNTYSGNTIITGGKIIVGNANALQNTTVSIGVNNGLDVVTNAIDASIGALAGTGNLNLGSTRLIAGANGNSTIYSGMLTGTSDSQLRKQGNGSLSLTGGTEANSSSIGSLRSVNGEVIIDGGHLDLTSDDFSLSTGALTTGGGDIQLRGGAVVEMNESKSFGFINNGTLTVSGNGTSLIGGRLDAANFTSQTGNIMVQNDASVALTGDLNIGINGVGDLTVQTGGQVSSEDVVIGIENANASTALVTGAGSRLIAEKDLGLGGRTSNSLGGTGELTVSDGGLVDIQGQSQFFTSSSRITVDGGTFKTDGLTEQSGVLGNIRIADTTGVTALTVGTNNGSSTFNGVIEDFNSNSGSLEKVGSGSLILNGSNTYSGNTIITGGKIVVGNANALQNSTVSIDVDDGLDVVTNAINASIGGLTGTGNLNLGSTTLTAGGNDTVSVYRGILSGTSASQLQKQGDSSLFLLGGTAANPSTIGSLRTTNGQLIVDGGHLDLTSNDFSFSTSALTVNGGTVQLSSGAVVAMTASNAVGLINNGSLNITGNGTSLTGNRLDAGEASSQTGSIVVQKNASLALDGALIVGASGTGDLIVQDGGQVSSENFLLGISNPSASTALITGGGQLIARNNLALGGQNNNSFGGTGELTVSVGGLVEVQEQTQFFTSSSSITVNRAALKTGQLSERSGVNGTIRIADAGGGTALTIGTNNGSSTFNGLIEDFDSTSGSLAKVGSGSLTLNGSNTYSGGTAINGGTLRANNTTGSATGSGSVDVNDGATLGGSGAIAGAVNVNSGGTLGPGNSPGELEVGSVLFDTDAIFNVEIGGLLAGTEYDVLDVLGNANLGGLLDVDLFDLGSGLFAPTLGDSFDILFADEIFGTFDLLSLDALTAGLSWDVLYLADEFGSTDIVRLNVVASTVPVPAAVWLFASGLLSLVGVARRKSIQ